MSSAFLRFLSLVGPSGRSALPAVVAQPDAALPVHSDTPDGVEVFRRPHQAPVVAAVVRVPLVVLRTPLVHSAQLVEEAVSRGDDGEQRGVLHAVRRDHGAHPLAGLRQGEQPLRGPEVVAGQDEAEHGLLLLAGLPTLGVGRQDGRGVDHAADLEVTVAVADLAELNLLERQDTADLLGETLDVRTEVGTVVVQDSQVHCRDSRP